MSPSYYVSGSCLAGEHDACPDDVACQCTCHVALDPAPGSAMAYPPRTLPYAYTPATTLP